MKNITKRQPKSKLAKKDNENEEKEPLLQQQSEIVGENKIHKKPLNIKNLQSGAYDDKIKKCSVSEKKMWGEIK